jgi:cell wall-associated NlpC family hydrolase
VTSREAEVAARLLERLLTDPAFREYFRRNPVAASREAGVESVANEIAMSAGKAMETLDGRESRSSLAGVFMAAALEGAGIYDFSRDLVPHLDGIPEQVEQVLSRVHHHGGLTTPAALSDVGGPGFGASPVEEPPPPPNAAGEFAAITPEQVAAGRGSHGADALLDSKRVSFDADGVADLKAGKLDPRLMSVLETISRRHTITVSATASDHPKLTSGGSVSNHFYGRALDIATVDGKPVSPDNAAAHELAIELSRLDPSIRPTEIGSPWALPGAAYFTDAEHQDHVHVGFDDPVAANWKAPEEEAASQAGSADGDPAPADDSEPAPADDAAPSEADDDATPAEPGGLEDAGGDTDAEADAENDAEGGDDDSDSDDASDEDEDDANDGEQPDADDGPSGDGGDGADGSSDGDHDDNSDSTRGSGGESTDGGDGKSSGDAASDGGDSAATGDGADVGDNAQVDLGDVAATDPSDDAPPAEIAAWMGSQAQKRGLPPELPVMAALVESSIHNLDHGDADSLGYFQMRSSLWNQGEYAGYPTHAGLQLKWFLDQAEAIKRQRIAAGKPVDDPNSYGDWIADVEQPRVDYRGRYQPRLEEARELLRQAGRGEHDREGSGAGVQVEPVADRGDNSAGPRAVAAVAEARKYFGTPYQWGGSSPKTGFDCSGLVQWAYAKAGIQIPRTSEQQILAANGTPVDRAHLRPGDLVFFRDAGGDVHHVGMSLGGDKFINAPHTGARVRIDDLNESYYAREFAGGRRFDVATDGEPRPAGVDPEAARRAEAALARDAAEAQRPGTLLFKAVRAQELRKLNHARVLTAIDPSAAP